MIVDPLTGLPVVENVKVFGRGGGVSGGGGGSWGSISGDLPDQTDLQDALDLKADTTTVTAAHLKDEKVSNNLTEPLFSGSGTATDYNSFFGTSFANTAAIGVNVRYFILRDNSGVYQRYGIWWDPNRAIPAFQWNTEYIILFNRVNTGLSAGVGAPWGTPTTFPTFTGIQSFIQASATSRHALNSSATITSLPTAVNLLSDITSNFYFALAPPGATVWCAELGKQIFHKGFNQWVDANGLAPVAYDSTSGSAMVTTKATQTLEAKTLTSPKISSGTVPATATSTGTAGQVQWDDDYIYVATATNSWKRAPLNDFSSDNLPVMARIFSPIKPSAQSGGFGHTFAGSIEFYNTGTYAIGDYAEFLVPLAAGNYDFDISYATFSSAGIIKLTVDGVDIGATIDAYSATTVRYLQTTRSSVAVAGGLTPIRIEVTGKNASSGNYRYIIQSILANKV